MISKLNFIGNVIDLGSVAIEKLTTWMCPCSTNLNSFEYPGDCLLHFSSTVSDQEMFELKSKNEDQDSHPVVMVLMNGNTSSLSVGCLNTIHAFVCEYSKGQVNEMSKEVCVLPCSYECHPYKFSHNGDSGSVVIDGRGRVCRILNGRDRSTDNSNCTFITLINFLTKCLADFGIEANILPLPADL
jgi:hypothetical protein